MMDIPTRREIVEDAKNNKKLIAAVFPIHYPREMFRAFGIYPIEVWGPPFVDTTLSKSHLQTYICSVVQSGLSFYLSGSLDVADMIFVPHCCDSLQGLGSIMNEFVKKDKPVFTLYIPRGKRIEDTEFLEKELRKLYEQIAAYTGLKPTNEELLNSTIQEEETDELVMKAYKIHSEYKTNSYEFYKLVRLREYLPVSLFKKLLDEFIGSNHSVNNATPIVFSGVFPEPKDVLKLVDDAGGVVVDDDFACLRRRIYEKGVSENPFKRMAERIVNGPPDAMKGSTFKDRSNFLLNIVKSSSAKGVVFYSVKFCEPEKFYIPILKEHLKKENIRSISIEVDINEPLPQQVKTRIKAFLESLSEV